MHKLSIQKIPNLLSLCRIPMSLLLPFLINNGWIFTILVGIIGLSDIADGYIARKYHCTSQSGALLDSLADLVFFVTIITLVLFKFPAIIRSNAIVFLLIIVVRIVSMAISKVKFKKIFFIHTTANKITGGLVFTIILLLPFSIHYQLINITLWFALAAAIEEMSIIIFKKTIDPNQKSIFSKDKRDIN